MGPKLIPSLLVIALLLTGVATVLNFNHILGLENIVSFLTGAATSTGTGISNLTITGTTAITNDVAAIQFGSGYVNASCSSCMIDSDGKINRACCVSFTNVTDGFLLENTGNLNLSVNYTCAGNCTAALFIGGTGPAFMIRTTNNLAAQQNNESGALDTVQSCNDGTFTNWNLTSYTAVSAAGDWLCGNSTSYPLAFDNTKDAGVIDINVTIPHDASGGGGVKTATFTFNAFSSG